MLAIDAQNAKGAEEKKVCKKLKNGIYGNEIQ